MSKFHQRLIWLLALAVPVVLLAGLVPLSRSVQAAEGVTFTITTPSIYLRSAPALTAPRVYSVFKGQTYGVLARTTDSAWVRLDYAGATTEAWVLVQYGTLTGDLTSVPATASSAVAPPTSSGPASLPTAPGNSDGAVTATNAQFTITAKSAYLRAQPTWTSAKVGSAFSGQRYVIVGRSADYEWLQILNGGSPAWVTVGAGKSSAPVSTLPVVGGGAPVNPALPTATPQSLTADTGGPVPAVAFSNVKFTVTIKAAYLRAGPDATTAKLGTAFSGQVFGVTGRSHDNLWVQVVNGSSAAWIYITAGKTNVPLGNLPVVSSTVPVTPVTPGAPPPTRYPGVNLKSEWIPNVSWHARDVYHALRAGKNLNMFTVAGDCNSENPAYLVRVVAGQFDLSGYDQLHGAVGQFAPGFARKSLAAHGGLSASAMFLPEWAHPDFCQKNASRGVEGPYECELRVSQASVVFLAVGAGDHPYWQSFEANYRRMIDYALSQQVLPILMTKPDDVEAQVDGAPSGAINAVIRRLAAEYDIPLMDFWLASRELPNNGMLVEKPQFHLSPAGFDMRTLYMLAMLDAVRR